MSGFVEGQGGVGSADKGRFALLLAVAAGRTVAECAAAGGVCEETVRRRIRDPKFMARVEKVRESWARLAFGRLFEGTLPACETLIKLLSSPIDSVKLGAAGKLTALVLQLGDLAKLQAKVAEFEALVAGMKEGASAESPARQDGRPDRPGVQAGVSAEEGG